MVDPCWLVTQIGNIVPPPAAATALLTLNGLPGIAFLEICGECAGKGSQAMKNILGSPTAGSVQHGLVATIQAGRLVVYDAVSFEVVQTKQLDNEIASKVKTIKFCNSKSDALPSSEPSARFLLASETSIWVYDAYDPQYHASVSAAAQPTGRIAHLTFLSADEILVFSDFNVKATLWHLQTGLGTEIRDPKTQRGTHAYAARPRSNHLAVLTRPTGGKEIIVVLDPVNREVEVSFALESQDASGVRWSLDGRWLAVWEASNLGPAVWIYTADGQLFRRWMGSGGNETEMGVRTCEWEPTGQWLLLGLLDGRIVGLRCRTFIPHFTFSHSASISVPEPGKVFQEQISTYRPISRDYVSAQQPAVPPTPVRSTTATTGTSHSIITHLSPSPNGALVASVSSSMPTTVWIHQLPSPDGTASTRAVLIHHHPIKILEWHPIADPPYLLIHCSQSSGVQPSNSADLKESEVYWAHIFSPSLDQPFALRIPLSSILSPQYTTAQSSVTDSSIRAALSWLNGDEELQLLLSTPSGSTIVSISNTNTFDSLTSRPQITGDGPEDAFDEVLGIDEEGDSLVGMEAGTEAAVVDDTFAFKTTGAKAKRKWDAGVTSQGT